jgi:GAF domain-containing protein
MILCVDPDNDAREQTRAALSEAGFDVDGVGTLADARDALEGDNRVDCVVTEYDLPDGTGLAVFDEARDTVPDAACLLFTDTPLADVDSAGFGDLVAEYVGKSDGRGELTAAVEHALAFRSQTAYPLPENENARLAALEQYAGDPEELDESLDRLTELATELFDLNAAAIGLIDAHHQEFLSCHGVAFDPLDREDTVCTYALLEDGVTVIEDVAADPRFADNDGLVADNIRFYASAPLVTPEGQSIGTFCVYDDDPRGFDDRDRELLALLGDQTMDQLVLRRRLRDARRGESDA